MSLKIINQNAEREYVLMQATKKVNIGAYALVDSIDKNEGAPTNNICHFLHFTPREIRKGEYVVVYTGSGTDVAYNMCDKTPVYIFYWNLKSFDWNNTGGPATLIRLSEIASKAVA